MMHSTMEQIGLKDEQVWGKKLPLLLLKDFRYQPEIWWDRDA